MRSLLSRGTRSAVNWRALAVAALVALLAAVGEVGLGPPGDPALGQPVQCRPHGSCAAKVGKSSWREAPTPSVAINTTNNRIFICNEI